MRQFLFCAVLCTVLAIASTARAEPRTFEIAISYEIAVTNEDVPLRMDLIVHNELCLVKTQQCWADNTMCRAALNTQFGMWTFDLGVRSGSRRIHAHLFRTSAADAWCAIVRQENVVDLALQNEDGTTSYFGTNTAALICE